MSKPGIYVMIITVSVSSMLATETLAQRERLSEIVVNLNYRQGKLMDLVSEIEDNTNFNFAYLDRSVRRKKSIWVNKTGRWTSCFVKSPFRQRSR